MYPAGRVNRKYVNVVAQHAIEVNAINAVLCDLLVIVVVAFDKQIRWHFLADSFTSYFRMMLVHLGVLGWQQAFSPVGLSPSTEQVRPSYSSSSIHIAGP